MKKLFILLVHLVLTVVTSGIWLIIYLTYKWIKLDSDNQSSKTEWKFYSVNDIMSGKKK